MNDNASHNLFDAIEEVAEEIAKHTDSDILFFNGDINFESAHEFVKECSKRNRRNNAIFILVTFGGDPNAAFRIARCLQNKYDKYSLYITGYCKSAGTLIAVGANEIIVSDFGELGHLDVQMSKKDELLDRQSGMTITSALSYLLGKTNSMFEKIFLDIENKSDGNITVKTAADIAVKLTIGLFSNIYNQIDPNHLGEAYRAISIANLYGNKLLAKSNNSSEDCLETLISFYPSHTFVIDREEIKKLFKNVREPNEKEIELAKLLDNFSLIPHDKFFFQYLSKDLLKKEKDINHEKPINGQFEQFDKEAGASIHANEPDSRSLQQTENKRSGEFAKPNSSEAGTSIYANEPDSRNLQPTENERSGEFAKQNSSKAGTSFKK